MDLSSSPGSRRSSGVRIEEDAVRASPRPAGGIARATAQGQFGPRPHSGISNLSTREGRERRTCHGHAAYDRWFFIEQTNGGCCDSGGRARLAIQP
jgi:hypothetical protein